MILVQRILQLKNTSLFGRMPPDSLALLAEAGEEKPVAKGENIFEQGSEGDGLYVILEGTVRMHLGEKTLNTLEQGDFFGVLSTLDDEVRTASATAGTDSLLLRIGQELFRKILRDHHELAESLINILAQRIRKQSADLHNT